MLKDLNHLMSCFQDNYIREDNFLQVNVHFFIHGFFTSSHAKYFIHPYILSSHSGARRIQNTQFKDNFSQICECFFFSSHLLLEYRVFHQMNEINCQ